MITAVEFGQGYEFLGARFAAGEYDRAVSELEAELRKHPQAKRFLAATREDFRNSLDTVSSAIDAVCARARKSFEPQAAYVEMNGFAFNTDEWFFDVFLYAEAPPANPDVEYFCRHGDSTDQGITLLGMERTQEAFQEHADNGSSAEDSDSADSPPSPFWLAHGIVVAKFVRYLSKSLRDRPPAASIPVWATTHEFNLFARVSGR